jgi:hypothetical protein
MSLAHELIRQGANQTKRLKDERRAAIREAIRKLAAETDPRLTNAQIAQRLRVSAGQVGLIRKELEG